MASLNYIIDYSYASLKGAAKLLYSDKDFDQNFDLSADGFWNSFIAIFFGLSLYLIFHWVFNNLFGQEGNQNGYVIYTIVSYGIYYPLLALCLPFILTQFGQRDRYHRLVISYHWFSLLIIIFKLALVAIVGTAFGLKVFMTISVFFYIFIQLVGMYYLVKASLKVKFAQAVQMVLILELFSLAYSFGALQLYSKIV